MMPTKRCPVCRGEFEVRTHRHCPGCGCPMNKGEAPKHSPLCRGTAKLQPGQECPVCHRLLAAGASCPVHGPPLPPLISP